MNDQIITSYYLDKAENSISIRLSHDAFFGVE